MSDSHYSGHTWVIVRRLSLLESRNHSDCGSLKQLEDVGRSPDEVKILLAIQIVDLGAKQVYI